MNSILKLALLTICWFGSLTLHAQNIYTIAGNGTPGFGGDNGPALASLLNFPRGIACDSAGNVYIADGSSRIRKINAAGIITTIAGTGTIGLDTGDGGPATAAMVQPNMIALDRAGNIYFTSGGGETVRRIDAVTGIITHIAGQNGVALYTGDYGPALYAGLNNPTGIAVDTNGNIYIADSYNQLIRKIDTAGIITPFCGQGPGSATYLGDGGPATAASIGNPAGLRFDRQGNLYFADIAACVVRKINTAGIISTVAGGGAGFVCDFGGFGELATASHTFLDNPIDVTVDAAGNIYICDYTDYYIGRVDAVTGLFTQVAGLPQNGSYTGDGGPATVATLYWPTGIELDAHGNLLISDGSNSAIRKVDLTTTIPSGITDQTARCTIEISPNPTDGVITISSRDIINTLEVYDEQGRRLMYEHVDSSKTSLNIDRPAGVYLIRINGNSSYQVIKK
jgi:sugar lactone lactonase YvrE